MAGFETRELPLDPDGFAPDMSELRLLLELREAGMAHFTLPPGRISRAVTHRSVEEIWYVLSGYGQIWRMKGSQEEVTELGPDLCLTIPLGTHFQFRNDGETALEVVIATIPTWPGSSEAIPVEGYWIVDEEDH